MEINTTHPQLNAAIKYLEEKLGDGNGQLTAADLLAAQQKASAEAQRFVTAQGALRACLCSLGIGAALGFLAALVCL